MNENIENVSWYSIGAFDYFIKREHHEGPSSILQKYTTKRENILSKEDENLINKQIASFKYTDDVLSAKRVEIKKNLHGRAIIKDHNQFDKKKISFISRLFKRGGFPIFDALLLNISDSITNEKVNNDDKLFEKTMKELSSFCYLHLIDEIAVVDALKYQTKALGLLNNIIDLDPEFFYIVDNVKQEFYPLIRNYIIKLYEDESKRENIIISLRTYEILDLFTIFISKLQLFPTTLIEYLITELVSDNKLHAWPENRYYCLKLFLLENLDPLDDDYLKFYDKYFVLENDNAYVMMALRAQYLGNMPLCRQMFNKIDDDKLNGDFYRYNDDLRNALDSPDENIRTYKNKDEILAILDSGDRERFDEYLDEFDISSSLCDYCLNECVKQLIGNERYNTIEIEAILYKNPTSLYNYLSKSSEYIKDKDIASLYIFTTILLNLNLINESYILLKRIIERIDCENSMVMNILNLQLLINKKFLGYII